MLSNTMSVTVIKLMPFSNVWIKEQVATWNLYCLKHRAAATECPKKINFDFHKGMYGTVAMLKTVADIYKYATFDSFKKLMLYFVHVHSK